MVTELCHYDIQSMQSSGQIDIRILEMCDFVKPE